jgi:predicted small metal-binding protein
MSKALYCNKVNPSSNCNHVVRGNTVEEVLSKAKTHAKEHGLLEISPALLKKLESAIEDE